MLVCRSEMPIPPKEREKLALFCNVRPEAVIAAQDLRSIYEAPLAYHKEGLDQAVLDAFMISPAPRPNLAKWEDVVDRIHNPEGEVRVAIVGKYTQLEDAYKSIAEALTHGGIANRVKVRAEWIDSERFEKDERHRRRVLEGYQRHPRARRLRRARHRGQDPRRAVRPRAPGPLPRHLPRHADGGGRGLAEPARPRATPAREEFDHEAGERRFTPVIYHLKEWLEGNRTIKREVTDDKGGTMRLGAYDAILAAGSQAAEIYDTTTISERHRHRYEVDIAYRDKLESCGLRFSGLSPDGRLPEIVEIPGHPWFIGVQFHPELKSKPFAPHPLFADFVRAAKEQSRLV